MTFSHGIEACSSLGVCLDVCEKSCWTWLQGHTTCVANWRFTMPQTTLPAAAANHEIFLRVQASSRERISNGCESTDAKHLLTNFQISVSSAQYCRGRPKRFWTQRWLIWGKFTRRRPRKLLLLSHGGETVRQTDRQKDRHTYTNTLSHTHKMDHQKFECLMKNDTLHNEQENSIHGCGERLVTFSLQQQQ